jgi:hypothetical protein
MVGRDLTDNPFLRRQETESRSYMDQARIPSVFVSSTSYDLDQMRADLKEFIERLGYDAVLSEYSSFPIDPDLKTVENCLRAVDRRADIFVLVVGGRYGSQTDEGKSITNLEYLRARFKEIPIYVFVTKSILHILPVWKNNPDADFKSVVDSPKLFKFIDELMNSEKVWVYPFERVQDIIGVLKTQLAYLLGMFGIAPARSSKPPARNGDATSR